MSRPDGVARIAAEPKDELGLNHFEGRTLPG
jgi:hypothetical protein